MVIADRRGADPLLGCRADDPPVLRRGGPGGIGAGAGLGYGVVGLVDGVGPYTALVILAEVGDVTRFGSARKLAAWAGLTPTVRGSDRTVRHGHISKQGSVWLRWILCEAAQTAKRHPDFAASYAAIARRRGKKIATTAIARKLLTRAWHLLADAEHAARPHASAPAPAT